MQNYIKKIKNDLERKRNSEYAKKMEQYMRDQFKFLGIKADERRKVTKKYKKKKNRPEYKELEDIIKKLWQLSEREYQYFAIELLEKYKKEFTEEIFSLFEYIIINKSWWDTVDRISKNLVGEYFKKFPEKKKEYIEKWINSNNIWLQRSTLLFQLAYKENTDKELLFKLIKKLKNKDEFFIQKAIGWALREYSKSNKEVVKKFINNNDLSSLATREGSKYI